MIRFRKKIVAAILAAQMTIGGLLSGIASAADSASVTALPGTPYMVADNQLVYNVATPHIVINQVYGAGLAADSAAPVTNGFIELYNPTDSDINLNGWSLQYADRGDSSLSGATKPWVKLDLLGTIKAHASYLVTGAETTSTSPKLDLTGQADQEWNTQFFNNKGLKVILVSNQNTVQEANPFDAATKKPTIEGYVDMAGVAANESTASVDGYETENAYDSNGQSKKKAVRRVDFLDTDNNKADFVQVDYSTISGSALEAVRPHNSKGQLDIQTTSLPTAYAGQPYTATISAAGGVAPYTFAVSGLPAGLEYSAEGAVYGAPVNAAYGLPITVTVTDSANPVNTKQKTLTLSVDTYHAPMQDSLQINKIADYSVGTTSKDGGVAEIVKFNKDNGKFYLVNGSANPPSLDIVSLGQANGSLQKEKSVLVADLAEKEAGFTFGDLTSVDINTTNKRIYAAVQAGDDTAQGRILELDYDGNLIRSFVAGVQPDMVKSTKDGRYILSADEAEPRDGIHDPAGSVTVIDTQSSVSAQVYFNDTSVIADDVHIRGPVDADGIISSKGSKADAYYDFEPEYIALSSDNKLAYVSLQENNAIAVIDIASKKVKSVKSLGFKDFNAAANALDVQSDGNILLENVPFKGAYMPDGIATYSVSGVTYLLTANEGDATEWPEEDPIRSNVSTIGDIKQNSLDTGSEAYAFVNGTSKYDSVQVLTDRGNDGIYLLGGRSFSIWNADTMEQVYDSGNDFEVITSQRLPQYFNTSNSKAAMDDRSTKKGPEPEDIKTGIVGNHAFAFVGLERVGGIMTYDITNPASPSFVNYTNSRVFLNDQGKANLDTFTGPEGIDFIPAEESPTGKPLLLVAFEVGGKVAVYELNTTKVVLDQKTLSLSTSGSSATLKATVTPVNGSDTTVTWTSSNASVATVDANGVVRPISAGTAIIRAVSADGYGSAEAVATVYTPSVVNPPSTTNPSTTDPEEPTTTDPGSNPGTPNPGTTAPGFSDVRGHWASEFIGKLAGKGIMEGMPDGSFQPNKKITRAEYMAVIARMLGLDTSSSSAGEFTDVPAGKWFAPYINTLASEGIAAGFSDGSFRPNQELTREEAFVLLYRAMKDKLGTSSGTKTIDSFADNGNVSPWAREAVDALVQAGLLEGTDGKLNPKQTITRAEIAKIIAYFVE